jgi:hypothetical protein
MTSNQFLRNIFTARERKEMEFEGRAMMRFCLVHDPDDEKKVEGFPARELTTRESKYECNAPA